MFNRLFGEKKSDGIKIDGSVNFRIDRVDGTVESYTTHNAITNTLKEALHDGLYDGTATIPTSGKYIALSAQANASTKADTTLGGEITTNGLNRALGAVTHTDGDNTTTIQKEFTASAAHTAIKTSALFSASTGGTMMHIADFPGGTFDLATNDRVTVTWSIAIAN